MYSAEITLLQTILYLPLVVSILIFLFGKMFSGKTKWVATFVVVIEFILTLYLWIIQFLDGNGQMMTNDPITWFSVQGKFLVTYQVGVDGLSMPLLFLSMIVFLASVLSSFYIKDREELYYGLFLMLMTGLIGTFVSLDLFVFYIFWEVTLVPMFFIIAIWGGPNKYYASFKFFIYTHLASLVMLIGIFYMYINGDGSFNMITLRDYFATSGISNGLIMLIFFLVFIGFVTKFPQVPVHTWLPDAHVQAPSPGSAILAGLLLKMGGYGLIRIGFWIFMKTNFFTSEEGKIVRVTLLVIAVISMFYPALIALKQQDLKRMIAYSSISHMGVVLIGLAAFNETGFIAAIFMMVAHGVISPALFLLAGIIEHNTKNHTRIIDKIGGLAEKMPFAGALFVFMGFASAGLPLLAGFVAEFLAFSSIFASDLFPAYQGLIYVGVLSIIITASYYLWAMMRVVFGSSGEELENAKPAKWWEIVPIYILAFFTLLFGVVPGLIEKVMDSWAKAIF